MTEPTAATADLLKQAAEKLRAAINNDYVFVAPWTAPGDGTVCDPEGAFAYRLAEPEAEYFALMHPPVAHALADLFELQAAFIEATPDAIVGEPLAAVARAILRED